MDIIKREESITGFKISTSLSIKTPQ